MARCSQFILVILAFQAVIISSKFHENYQKSSPTYANNFPWPAMKLDTEKNQDRIVTATQALKASACSFRGLMAHCQMTVGGHHIDAAARINKCHTPIDIYFLVTDDPSAHNTDNTVSTKYS